MSLTLARVEPSVAGVGDYIELMKPRVMSLVVFTAMIALARHAAGRSDGGPTFGSAG
jgi:heme O synthase-like polyprenyltransferase